MAVNYGLGGFESEFAFAAQNIASGDDFSITINTQNVFENVLDAKISQIVIGDNTAGVFSNAYRQVDQIEEGKLKVKTSGVYLVSYNLTTTDPTNKTISLRIVKENDIRISAIGGLQSGYCRSADQFEIGSNCLAFLESGDRVFTQVSNTDGTQNVTFVSLNISIVKLNYSGRVNS